MFDQHPDEICATTTRLLESAEWRLLEDGLEHRSSGYFIARDMIAMRRGDLWEWPMHLAEKTWCSPRAFREAFLAALDAFGIAADADLTRSFALGFGLVARSGPKAGTEEFVALGDFVRPKASVAARKRGAGAEPRSIGRRGGHPVPQRAGDASRQRAIS